MMPGDPDRPTTSRFERDTAVSPTTPGRYRGHVDPDWAVFPGAAPNGGYLLAMAARAMAREADRPDPVTVTAHFLAPPDPGAVDIDVEVVRRGRHVTVQAQLRQAGRACVQLLGAFGDLATASGPSRIDRAPPALPEVGQCVPATDRADAAHAAGGPPPSPIFQRFEHHVPASHLGWMDGQPSGRGVTGGYLRWRDRAPMDVLGLLVVADCYPPAVFGSGLGEVAWVPTIELTVQVRARPTGPGLLRTRFVTEAVTAGYLEEDGEVWDTDGRLLVLSRQLALAARPRRS